MAGVTNQKNKKGEYRGWYTDRYGKRVFRFGFKSKKETKKLMDQKEELEKKTLLSETTNQPIGNIVDEYYRWGAQLGGRKGGWSEVHSRKIRSNLSYWIKILKLKMATDLIERESEIETHCVSMLESGKSEKTVSAYCSSFISFTKFAAERKYIKNPVKLRIKLDTKPTVIRRVLTKEELNAILEVTPYHRNLLYRTAAVTGLRANELRSLLPESIDLQRGGLILNAAWTKNRKDGFQPAPTDLLKELSNYGARGEAGKLYSKHLRRKDSGREMKNPLLFVSTHPSRELDIDMELAGVEKVNVKGKVDFHALRTLFVSKTVELGASIKEAQELARHSDPRITINIYSRANEDKLHALTESLSQTLFSTEDSDSCAHSVQFESESGPQKEESPCSRMTYRDLSIVEAGGTSTWGCVTC